MEIKLEATSVFDMEKKVNRRGGLTIPAAIRRSSNLEGGDKFIVHSLAGGDLYLERLTGRCTSCGAPAYQRTESGHFICDSCKQEMEEKE